MTSDESSTAERAASGGQGDFPSGNGSATGAKAPPPSDGGGEDTLARLVARGVEIVSEVRTLLSVRSEEARLRLRRWRWSLVRGVLLGLAGVTLAVTGAFFLARGLARALAALAPRNPGLGELLAGLLLLGLVGGGLALLQAREERRELERLRRKYAHDTTERASGGAEASGRADGGAAPGGRAEARASRAEPEPGAPGR